MSDLTAELNLALCVDNDDTADYLTTTAGLRGSLNVLDGLFNATTGHNHSGAHQGGGFTSLTLTGLTVNGNVSVTGTLTVQGATHLSTLQVDSALTTSSTLDVAGTSRLRGAVTADSSISAGGTIRTSAGAIVAPNNVPGFCARNAANTADCSLLWLDSNNSTVVMAGPSNVTRFVNGANSVQWGQFDTSGNWIQQAGTMYVGADPVTTPTASQTLTNKTLNSDALNNCSINGYQIVGTASGNFSQAPHIESGIVIVNTPAGSGGNFGGVGAATVTFARAFTAPPVVVITWDDQGAPGDVSNYAHGVSIASTTQFVARAQTNQGSVQNVRLAWIAFGV